MQRGKNVKIHKKTEKCQQNWCATRQVDNEKNKNFYVARFMPGNILCGQYPFMIFQRC